MECPSIQALCRMEKLVAMAILLHLKADCKTAKGSNDQMSQHIKLTLSMTILVKVLKAILTINFCRNSLKFVLEEPA